MSPIDWRRAACSVATWMATRWTELNGGRHLADLVVGVHRDRFGDDVEVAGVLGVLELVDQAGQPLVGDLVGAAGQGPQRPDHGAGQPEGQADREPQHQGQEDRVEQGLAAGAGLGGPAGRAGRRRPRRSRPPRSWSILADVNAGTIPWGRAPPLLAGVPGQEGVAQEVAQLVDLERRRGLLWMARRAGRAARPLAVASNWARQVSWAPRLVAKPLELAGAELPGRRHRVDQAALLAGGLLEPAEGDEGGDVADQVPVVGLAGQLELDGEQVARSGPSRCRASASP